MDLIEKLERRAKQLDPFRKHGYDQRIADDRELLLKAVSKIKELTELYKSEHTYPPLTPISIDTLDAIMGWR